MFGQYVKPDGSTGSLDDLPYRVSNPLYVAFTISVGSIGYKIKEIFGLVEADE